MMAAGTWRRSDAHTITNTTHPFLRPDPWAGDRERARAERLADADLLVEHVLRGSKSFTARSFRSRPSTQSLRVPSMRSNVENLSVSTNASDALPRLAHTQMIPLAVSAHQILGEIAPNNQTLRTGPFINKLRPSPTPSLKRKKAEAIVKAHGSPTHIRVTAGGRIVPSEQSPLCYPRYGYSAINLNGSLIKFAPNVQAGQPQWTKATEDGFVAQDEHGNLSQIVNGTILPLHEIDGALRLYMPAPNLKISVNRSQHNASKPPLPDTATDTTTAVKQLEAPQSKPVAVPSVSVDAQIQALEVEYSKLERDLKELNKTEVIHGRAMTRVAKEALYSQRRNLVASLDKLRKAIKSLKCQPPPNAPTSPRAMLARHPVSPPRNRLPTFLQMQHAPNMLAPQIPQGGNNYQALPPPSFSSQYGSSAPTDESYAGHSWAVPPPGVFATPSFDGSFSMYSQPALPGPILPPPVVPTVTDMTVPQSDGARSFADLPVASSHRSRAVSIKVPETKPTTNLKSNLNPMSPVYKPGSGPPKSALDDGRKQYGTQSASTNPQTSREQSSIPQDNSGTTTASPETTFIVSPSKRSGHLQSSSISSFETADFFPRNPREYSTRQHDYPIGAGPSEDKENRHRGKASGHDEYSPATPEQNQNAEPGRFQATAAPPGTPILDSSGRPAVPAKVDGYREENNVSPKSKREWLYIAEEPTDPATQPLPPSSPVKAQSSLEAVKRIPSNSTLDFSQKPREWIEGFQAGLHRRSIGSDCNGKYIDGYCSGLLRSKPKDSGLVSVAPATGSPMKTLSRRPSPSRMSRPPSRLQVMEQAPPVSRPPFESAMHSMDTLKQAVFAPQNENAILTPAPEGPHVTETVPNLGGWSKNQHSSAAPADVHSALPFPKRTSSVIKQHRILSEGNPPQEMGKFQDPRRVTDLSGPYLGPKSMDRFSHQPASPALSTMSIASGSESNNSHRVMSLSGIDSSLARPWPSSRIITPIGSSVAHATGLATGYFASAQFDGTNDQVTHADIQLMVATGASQIQRATSITSTGLPRPHAGRFRECSLDGDRLPLLSPSPDHEGSPNQTPRGRKKDSSPGKGPSPAKAKFEHIAERVGIKVSATSASWKANESGCEPGSPPGKRRWRDVWRKGGKEDGGI